MVCKKLIRRRTALKCLLLTLLGYMTYISLATFGKVPDIKPPDGDPVDYPVLDNPVALSRLAEIKKLIDKHDNFKNYLQIKDNGILAKGMIINEKNLSREEKNKFDEGWSKYAFNNYASSLIPMNRTLPDIRLPGYNKNYSLF